HRCGDPERDPECSADTPIRDRGGGHRDRDQSPHLEFPACSPGLSTPWPCRRARRALARSPGKSMTRPNLFIVGAPKCGTTAWVEYLSSHPEIFFCDPKEPHFFNTDIPNFRWVRSLDEYLKLFVRAGSKKVVGEASILYLYSQEAAER